MKRMLMLTVATAALLSVASTSNAQTVFDGFYAGAGIGAANDRNIASSSLTQKSPLLSITTLPRTTYSNTTYAPKVFGGYNMVFDRWLVGAEGAYQPSISSTRTVYNGNTFSMGSDSGIISVTGRLGYLVQPDLLLYGFAGYAGRQQNFASTIASSTFKSGSWFNGLTGGLGVEYALMNNVFLRGEVEYTQFNAANFNATSSSVAGFSTNSRRDSSRYGGTISIGYRF